MTSHFPLLTSHFIQEDKMELIKEQEIDIRKYYRILKKRKWIIIALFFLVVGITAVQTFSATPLYQAAAQIVIEKENPNVMSIQEVLAVDSTGTDYYQTQYQIITSRTVARKVIAKLNLQNSPEFCAALGPREDNFVSNIKNWFAEPLRFWKEKLLSLRNTGKPEDKDKKDEDADAWLVNALIGRIKAEPVRNSRLVNVRVEAKDPALAAKIANEVVQAYIDQNLETKLTAAKDAVKWLIEQMDEERKKVEISENALLNYKETQGIITNFSNDAENITAEKLAKLNAQVVESESQRVEAETRYRQALAAQNSPDMLDSISQVLNNPLVQDIKKMEVELYNRMSELSKKYGAKHPQITAITSELATLQERKMGEAKRVVSSLRNEYNLALAREQSLKQALNRQKTESLDMNKKAIRYGVLQRDAESSRNMYELLVKRFKEASLTEEMKTGNIRIIDRAEVPKAPVSPNKTRNILLGAVLGLMLGIGMVFALEYFDNTFKFPEEIKNHLDIPYLGPVPVFDTEEGAEGAVGDLITVKDTKAMASESFRGIRTGILFSSVDTPPKVILVTSAAPSEGKTICIANLAVTMAQDGSKVIILDCDMRRPRVHHVFQLPKDKGMSGLIAGKNKLDDVIFSTGIENLDVIPSGPVPPNPAEIIGSKKMTELLEELKTRYDKILIDSPPVMAVTDSLLLAGMSDGVVLIIKTGLTARQMVKNALEQIESVKAKVLGAVLNAIKADKDSYYYYQYYYYYYGEDGARKKKRHNKKKRSGVYGRKPEIAPSESKL